MTKKQKRAALHREWRKNYEDYLRIQGLGERCAICKKPPKPGGRKLAIDSDHKTDLPRGLLCGTCNRRLKFYLKPKWLRAAAEYLENPPLKDIK